MHNTLTTLIERQARKYGRRMAFAAERHGQWMHTSWTQLQTDVQNAACAMEILDLQPTQMVAVFAPNMPGIIVTDFAAYANRAVPVSIYDTSSADQVKYIINDAGAVMAFAGDKKQFDILCQIAPGCPTLRQIVVYDDIDTTGAPIPAMTFDNFLLLGSKAGDGSRAEVRARTAAATPQDTATLIYTSGTTGEPKGAVLPHSCFDAALQFHHRRLTHITDTDTSLCFLPLSHIFEKAWTYYSLDSGIRVFINRDPREVQHALRDVRPTIMCSVPRFWEKVYTGIQDKIGRMGFFKRLMVKHALYVGRRRNNHYRRLGLKVPAWLERQYRFYDRLVFRPVRRVVGVDNGRMFPTAGAPLSPEIFNFMRAIDVPLLLGYGLSETTASVTIMPDHDWEAQSVGVPLPGIEVRLGDQNEIQVKSPTVMSGYHNKPQATAEAFTADGWLRTGDAGRFDDNGQLILTDRIKDLFKTSNGKYIAPQLLESRLGEDMYIEQAAVIGDRRKYVTAIIVPAFEALKEYARRKHIAFKSRADLIRNADIRKMLEERIEQLQKDRAGFEKIKKFTLLPHEFSIETGELTNTLKLRRAIINKLYAKQIEAMYA